MSKQISTTAAVITFFFSVFSLNAAEFDDGLKQLEAGDFNSAFSSFSRALSDGNGDAAFYLGRMYEDGFGVAQDRRTATELYKKGRDLKSPLATLRMGYLSLSGGAGVLQSYGDALRDICAAGDLGNMEGKFSCGKFQIEGTAGEKNVVAGMALIEEAANAGNLEALNYLGNYYASDENADRAKSLEYFSRSASKFDPIALFQMGLAQEQGVGTEVNLVEAHVYYNLSNSIDGNREAAAALRRVTAALTEAQLFQSQEKAGKMLEEQKKNN